MADARALELRNYIKAKSPMGLRRLMLRENAKHGLTIQYDNIQFVKGSWYAWYYLEVKNDDPLLRERDEQAVKSIS